MKDIEKILLDEFTPLIYNDVNQAGEEMLVIDVDDLNKSIDNLVEKLQNYAKSIIESVIPTDLNTENYLEAYVNGYLDVIHELHKKIEE